MNTHDVERNIYYLNISRIIKHNTVAIVNTARGNKYFFLIFLFYYNKTKKNNIKKNNKCCKIEGKNT